MLKVYAVNYDGKVQRVVAAKSMAAAARLVNVPYYHMRNFGHETFNEATVAKALSKPGVVFQKKFNEAGMVEVRK